MASRTRIQPLNRDFELALQADLDPSRRSAQFARFAEEEIEKAAQENRQVFGRDVEKRVFVDGREGVSLESVSPTGTITARFELIEDVLSWIAEQLVKGSPVRRGRYVRSHIMLADGMEVVQGTPIPDAKLYSFVNTQPYARKIEGTGGRPPQSRQAAQGVYEVVAALANQRFGNIARVTYGWQSLSSIASSALETWAGNTSHRRVDRSQRAADREEWLRRQPTIFVRNT